MKNNEKHPLLDENIHKLMIYLIAISFATPKSGPIRAHIRALNEVLEDPEATIEDFNQQYLENVQNHPPKFGHWIHVLNSFIKSSKKDAIVNFNDIDEVLLKHYRDYAKHAELFNKDNPDFSKLKKYVSYLLENIMFGTASKECAKQAKRLFNQLNELQDSPIQYIHALLSFCRNVKKNSALKTDLTFNSLIYYGKQLFRSDLNYLVVKLEKTAIQAQKQPKNLDKFGLFGSSMQQRLIPVPVPVPSVTASLGK